MVPVSPTTITLGKARTNNYFAMIRFATLSALFSFILIFSFPSVNGQTAPETAFQPMDIFELEHVSDPQISPDGSRVAFLRNYRDVMTDRTLSNLWMASFDGSQLRPLSSGLHNDSSPAWSPDGSRLAYRSDKGGKTQLYLLWVDSGQEAMLTNLTEAPGRPVWSPDGKWLAFTLFVAEEKSSLVKLPQAPKGAKWAEAPNYIDQLKYRSDGAGYLRAGHRQLFVLPVEGGTPRQLTKGPYHCSTPVWSADGKSLFFSANRHPNAEMDPGNSEIYELSLSDAALRPLTNRHGPDNHPAVSPDGKLIAYTGYDEQYLGYQNNRLYVMNRDGSNPRLVSGDFDRSIENIHWDTDGRGLYFQYDDRGATKVAFMELNGSVKDLTAKVSGLSIGRPYSGGDYSVSKNGRIAFTHGDATHPADLATCTASGKVQRITHLNDDLFGHKKPGKVEEHWCKSSAGNVDIQYWVCYPPNFDPQKKYPLILEIHGGPFAMYGDHYSAEIQLYAAAGYLVVYANPRGSSGYGSTFGNLIHHNYPNEDFDDLMSVVDAVIDQGHVDKENLFVTGGSGGGVLTAWIVGHTQRFRAAVVAKPVINWYSFVLTADNPGFFYKYWFPGLPWEHLEHYMKRSPISYAGEVKTPTLLLTGEVDYRTPIEESEQFYTALKLAGVEAAMVRFPQASHGIANRPSYLMSKAMYVLGWFDKHKG